MSRLQNVVYWGQNGGNIVENDNLAEYCASASGINIIVLAFLYNLSQETGILSGSFGQSCAITSSGYGQGCDNIASAIKTCQAAGIKIIISMGGWASSIILKSQSQAESIGQYLWDAYGNPNVKTVPRPFGNTLVDGFDFDIEHPDGAQYYQYLIAKLRTNFAKDLSHKYYITGAPQCSLPEPNMGEIIKHSEFDYLWIQFYNNDCALGLDDGEHFNYYEWTSFLSTTPSRNASLFFGLPASSLASTGTSTGSKYYVTPEIVAQFINSSKSGHSFGGVMIWSAGFSDANINNECTYAQNIHHILLNGSACGQSDSLRSSPSATLMPTSAQAQTSLLETATASESVGIPMWGQCGGQGYFGPTQCLPPYRCIQLSNWWSSCH
ncbi:carbohydrate-binding module family 1 protein [Trichoderma asperellum CBS 433.97]|uniref:chitinase n=1 Tax=Trichoderma asperellum (strain ATCC 204424 / CBS 433.97 / NBRC 101777) TaxID=1042311 RepID=A0A2T3Z6E4_TRIA4|nr:carbohydrate-binding module family 1 protein [Trichoderma asperellum CBS 433.97]PTB40379.1 carbohydrate-binding module family 1 protein [Trichoderma asperellum CBS 433.97]